MALARAGCDVAVADISSERAKIIADQIADLGRLSMAITSDAMDEADLETLPARVSDQWPSLHIMVDVIGAAGWSPLLEMSSEMWDREQAINLKHVFILGRAFAVSLRDRERPGSIVCISSLSGIQSAPGHAAYGVAKAGMISLVKSMAVEWAQFGIRVNSVAPGTIATPRRPETPERAEQVKQSNIPFKRRGTPDEVASAVLFFASDLSSYVTGQTLAVDGGWTAANLLLGAPQ
jgi:NAD(P)-dependent dehydrogenase (short-subunit alcohol dehydrogenase family)